MIIYLIEQKEQFGRVQAFFSQKFASMSGCIFKVLRQSFISQFQEFITCQNNFSHDETRKHLLRDAVENQEDETA